MSSDDHPEMNGEMNGWLRAQGGTVSAQQEPAEVADSEERTEEGQFRTPDGRYAGEPPVTLDQGAHGRGIAKGQGSLNERVNDALRYGTKQIQPFQDGADIRW